MLDALTLTLSPQALNAKFVLSDFYHAADSEAGPVRHLQIVLTFRETRPGRSRSRRFRELAPLWRTNGDEYLRINYRVSADLADDNTITSQRTFLDEAGEPLLPAETDKFISEIIRLYPVLRLRDARFMRGLRKNVPDCEEEEYDLRTQTETFNNRMADLTRALVSNPQTLSNDDLQDGLEAMKQLLSHYFAEQGEYLLDRRKAKRLNIEPRQRAWQALEGINRVVAGPNQRNVRLIILGMFAALLQSNSGLKLDPYARPIIIVEDPKPACIRSCCRWRGGCSICFPYSALPPPTPVNCFHWYRFMISAAWCGNPPALPPTGWGKPSVTGRAAAYLIPHPL